MTYWIKGIGSACLSFLLADLMPAQEGPVAFGRKQLDLALARRGLTAMPIDARIEPGRAESFRIVPGHVTGGDARGLMYGLLEAAEQIDVHGKLVSTQGSAATPVRGVRYFLHNEKMEAEWYYSEDYWHAYFSMLARNRYNRFNLVFAHQTNYLSPPYPYWFSLDGFPEIRVRGLTAEQQRRNLQALRFLSQTAESYGIEFTLGIWQHDIQPWMERVVPGITPENIGPYSYAALKRILAECPSIRGVQLRTNRESGLEDKEQAPFYTDWIFRAIREASPQVRLELRGWVMEGGLLEAAMATGAPVRLSCKYWAEHRGRPHQPAEIWERYSYMDFLKQPRPYELIWELWGMSNRLLLWGDPDYVRRAAATLTLSGTSGFEIDPPLAQKGYGNSPETWGVFQESQKDRVFWKWEFERYWLFYLLWGRLSYDPGAGDHVWTRAFRRRFGRAREEAMRLYQTASQVMPEIVSAHMADPNQRVWPEINPGGLIDSYLQVRPSEWRFFASIQEAAQNAVDGVASAKQTPLQTAARLVSFAERIGIAARQLSAVLGERHSEWRGSEPDFRVLEFLARYHAAKLRSAQSLEWFYRTGSRDALSRARLEAAAGLGVWRELVAYTADLYPRKMSFARGDMGHWKDKLPYVEFDLALLDERLKVHSRFPSLDYAFDFGPTPQVRPTRPYFAIPALFESNVEPRFSAVGPDTIYSDERGYGWLREGLRKARAVPPIVFDEVRAIASRPTGLRTDVLYADWIEGAAADTFRVRVPDGQYDVSILLPDESVRTTSMRGTNGYLDIQFEKDTVPVSGLVITGDSRKPAAAAVPEPKPSRARAAAFHLPPDHCRAGEPLELALKLSALQGVRKVRLHYRPLRQQTAFRTLESSPAPVTRFRIPGEDVLRGFDMLYYFELLDEHAGGWFHPDPLTSTPYYVAPVQVRK